MKRALPALLANLFLGGILQAAPAYLGVITRPVDPTLGAQLGLPPGIGIVVSELDSEGPGGALLQPNDVLHRFEDQWLIGHEHLRILVGTHEAGDEVTLSVFREGKPVSVKAVLAERPAGSPVPGPPSPRPVDPFDPFGPGDADALRDMMQRMQEHLRGHSLSPDRDPALRLPPVPGTSRTARTHGKVQVQQDGYQVTVETVDGHRTARVQDDKGTVLFDGPINTEEEREALPPKAREMVERLSIRSRTTPGGPVI